MSEKIKSFDFFSPVLSTDIVKIAAVTPNYNDIKPVSSKKKQKKKKEKWVKPIKVNKPETQEEIDAWIAERRKKYPTKLRIAEKEQSAKERLEMGALNLEEETQIDVETTPRELSAKSPHRIQSFLDVLVADELRKEKSKILQCFRYFVSHNYLQK